MMDLKTLENELQAEKKSKESLLQASKNLEKRVAELKAEMSHMRKQVPEVGGKDSEGYKNLQEQITTNSKLEKNIALEKERLTILKERNTDITQMDLDLLSQTELIRLVKQLERVRTDLQSNLREIQASLDQQAQDYTRLNEMKNLYQAEQDLRNRRRRQTMSHHTGTART